MIFVTPPIKLNNFTKSSNNDLLAILTAYINTRNQINIPLLLAINTSEQTQQHLVGTTKMIGSMKNKMININLNTVKLVNHAQDLITNINQFMEIQVNSITSIQAEKLHLHKEQSDYILHAIVPGRAWLRSSRGSIISVIQRDLLANYGKIIIIDSVNYLVQTSSVIIIM